MANSAWLAHLQKIPLAGYKGAVEVIAVSHVAELKQGWLV